MMLMTQLNRECLLHLFSFLDKDGRRSLSLTCRGLREVFLDPSLWPLLCFHAPCEIQRDNYVLGPALRYLSICWHSSRVKVCNIEDWAKTPFQKDICRKHEPIVSTFLARVCERCPNLLSLTLSGCGHIEDQDVVLLLQSCLRLRALQLENCARITDSVLHAAVTQGRSLTTVRVDFCRNVTRDGLRAIREGLPGVRLSAERSAGMIPDSRPQEKPQQRRALRKVLLFS
ncbi:hypothetical protein AAFF_G00224750 [Aldrovandia affinis]|uniref:F-box domain-containing protein n=1 Tax=Aldrovandia affinis TaxID=143900 RepID=A0AAD7TAY3_9TELE|nr:hypothetical protein AAFF_G00224750 [Aldrovandia affinis]